LLKVDIAKIVVHEGDERGQALHRRPMFRSLACRLRRLRWWKRRVRAFTLDSPRLVSKWNRCPLPRLIAVRTATGAWNMARDFHGAGSVLVVEDEPLIRIFLADMLRDAGLYVTEACTADEAAGILNDQRYSAVLTDVTMPGRMDGIELARHVCRAHPGTAVIVASANDVGGDVPRDVPFLRKPYNVRQLVNLVTAMVRDARDEDRS
jgi:CheY-like chemotaxis protein